jgi:hypothetical protein
MPILTEIGSPSWSSCGYDSKSSWSRMVILRKLLACNSEQYFTFPASDAWSETMHILVRKQPSLGCPERYSTHLNEIPAQILVN